MAIAGAKDGGSRKFVGTEEGFMKSGDCFVRPGFPA